MSFNIDFFGDVCYNGRIGSFCWILASLIYALGGELRFLKGIGLASSLREDWSK